MKYDQLPFYGRIHSLPVRHDFKPDFPYFLHFVENFVFCVRFFVDLVSSISRFKFFGDWFVVGKMDQTIGVHLNHHAFFVVQPQPIFPVNGFCEFQQFI